MKRLTLIILLFLSSPHLWGAVSFEDATMPEFATSGRALAMGNAFISKVDDSSAAFYNPAGLGTIRKGVRFHLSNFTVESNSGWMSATSGGSAFDIPTSLPKGFTVEGNREILINSRDKLAFSKFSLMPNLTFRNFSMGFLFGRQLKSTIASGTTAPFEFASRQDMGPYWSFNLPLFGGVLKFGATAIWLSREEASGDVDKDTPINLTDADYNSGTSWQIIGGFKMTMPVWGLPTIALKMNNAAGNKFGHAEGAAAAPETIKQSVDAGFSLSPQVGRAMRIHIELNFKDALGKYEGVSALRRTTFGIEFDVKRTFFVRLGYGDGFGSGGLGINTRKLQFDLTTYAVDTTSNQFRGEEDRRYALTVSSGF